MIPLVLLGAAPLIAAATPLRLAGAGLIVAGVLMVQR